MALTTRVVVSAAEAEVFHAAKLRKKSEKLFPLAVNTTRGKEKYSQRKKIQPEEKNEEPFFVIQHPILTVEGILSLPTK